MNPQALAWSTCLAGTYMNSEAYMLVHDLIPGWCCLAGNGGPCGTIHDQVEPYMSGALLLMTFAFGTATQANFLWDRLKI
jgi:hypothetical protein